MIRSFVSPGNSNGFAVMTSRSRPNQATGGFGITPKDHFNKLRKLLPGLKGLAILDNDGRAKQDVDDSSLRVRYWKRYEIENGRH